MLLAPALLHPSVVFAVASTHKAEGEGQGQSDSQAVGRGRSLFPLLKGPLVSTPRWFGSSSVSEGSLSFGKCTAGSGFGLLGKKHLLVLFVLLPAQLCEEWGWRGWDQPC